MHVIIFLHCLTLQGFLLYMYCIPWAKANGKLSVLSWKKCLGWFFFCLNWLMALSCGQFCQQCLDLILQDFHLKAWAWLCCTGSRVLALGHTIETYFKWCGSQDKSHQSFQLTLMFKDIHKRQCSTDMHSFRIDSRMVSVQNVLCLTSFAL